MTRLHFPNFLMDTDIWTGMLADLARGKFPHTDIIKLKENKFLIQMSLAGYNKEDISVSQERQVLTVEGKCRVKEDVTYLMHGISKKNFIRNFPLAENIDVEDANMREGVLSIGLVRNIPENEQLKEFDIK